MTAIAISEVPVHSAIARMLQASDRLPERLRAMFSAEFMEAKSKAEICCALGLTEQEYETHRTEMLRNLRAAAA